MTVNLFRSTGKIFIQYEPTMSSIDSSRYSETVHVDNLETLQNTHFILLKGADHGSHLPGKQLHVEN